LKRSIEKGVMKIISATRNRLVASHLSMRRTVSLIVIAVFALAVVINWSFVSAGIGQVTRKLSLYMHVARLYAMKPDSQLAMPIKGVSRRDIADTWHAARGSDRKHEGQDIFARRGTSILSATEGYVVDIGENSLGGKTVSVVGAGGRVYYYAHLDSYAQNLYEGDHVTTQTVLGYVGTTGNATGTPPHLHFGVYEGTGAIDPLPLLVKRPDGDAMDLRGQLSAHVKGRRE
jgi:murein DD-endopeptidase MepM/ murein hydrolase activator NlpD